MILPSFAESSYNDYAEKLKLLGVFTGTGSGFELDREPTRLEGLIMFIRLLGAESNARNGQFSHPFTDVPQWANGYVGWAYENGYTKGVSQTKFGVGNIDSKSYLTLMLRALGYDDSKGDFSWNNSVGFSKNKGVITNNDAIVYTSEKFLRDHVAKISYDVLGAYKKDGMKLSEFLVKQNALESSKLMAMGIDFNGNAKYDSKIFTVREHIDLEIAEVIKGSTLNSYDPNLHTSKILKHGQSYSLYSNEFESMLTGLKVVRGFLFYEKQAENLGSVNLVNSGLEIYTRETGNYFVDDYLNYILKKPYTLNNTAFLRYVGLNANYVNDETFRIMIDTDDEIDDNMVMLVHALIKNIISDNPKSDMISKFIASEMTTRFNPKNKVNTFGELVGGRYYYTQMYVEGYYITFTVGGDTSLYFTIK